MQNVNDVGWLYFPGFLMYAESRGQIAELSFTVIDDVGHPLMTPVPGLVIYRYGAGWTYLRRDTLLGTSILEAPYVRNTVGGSPPMELPRLSEVNFIYAPYGHEYPVTPGSLSIEGDDMRGEVEPILRFHESSGSPGIPPWQKVPVNLLWGVTGGVRDLDIEAASDADG